jgi:hypothetical protein
MIGDELHESEMWSKDEEGVTSCRIFKTKPIGITSENVFIVMWIMFASHVVLAWNSSS